MENLGKRAAILAASRLMRSLHQQTHQPLRLLELGCGEGQVIGLLADSHAQLCASDCIIGVDYNPRSLARCQRDYPGFRFQLGDFTEPSLLATLEGYDIVLLVNALHEVFSATVSPTSAEVDIPLAKQRVEQALAGAVQALRPGGWLVLFDGLEPPGDLNQTVQMRFLHRRARALFELFARQYRPFHITFRVVDEAGTVELSRRDFTRYITKSIFLGKQLWQTERSESYQYFTETEFRAAFDRLGMEIVELRTLSENSEKWSRAVELISPGAEFPTEHILILAQRRMSL